jgi:hypothetical protein
MALRITLVAVTMLAAARDRGHRVRGERGDVPGWVLVTVMTAGLVAALWAVAGDTLTAMLTDALNSVTG